MKPKKKTIGVALTWDDLANAYDKESSGGRPARTLPMEQVFNHFERKKNEYYVHPTNGTIHKIEGEREVTK